MQAPGLGDWRKEVVSSVELQAGEVVLPLVGRRVVAGRSICCVVSVL